jgi:hypothetical protein
MPTRLSLSGNTDPDSKNKDKGESEYEDFFGEQFELQFQEIQDRLNTKEPEALPNSFWEKWGSIFLAFVIPTFTAFQLDGAKTQMDDLGIGVDWDFVTDQAANFSSTHAFALVKDLNDKSLRHLQTALMNFYQSPERDVDALIQTISTRFGETRAENIAITEVTRGYERGKEIYTDELWKIGVKAEPIWHTMDDERVCVICAPNDGKRKSEGWTADGIPAHPRDRCWTTLVVVEKR